MRNIIIEMFYKLENRFAILSATAFIWQPVHELLLITYYDIRMKVAAPPHSAWPPKKEQESKFADTHKTTDMMAPGANANVKTVRLLVVQHACEHEPYY